MFLADILFPRVCIGCGFLGCSICPYCKNKLSYLERDACLYCRRASPDGFTHQLCQKTNGVDGVLAILHYNDFLKKVISTFKYQLVTDLWNELKLILPSQRFMKLGLYKKLNGDFVLQPIPLHARKLKDRGFNQAQMIADYFRQYLGLQTIDSLVRNKETLAQAQLTNNMDRQNNLRNAFQTASPVEGKNIILIDDVVTSGATVKEAARTLKRKGARLVFVLALARGR